MPHAANIRTIPPVNGSQLVSFASVNLLIAFANALTNVQCGPGLSLQFGEDKVTLSATDSVSGSSLQNTFTRIERVKGGEAIDDRLQDIVRVANVFANIQAGPGIWISKSDDTFEFELMDDITDEGETVGTVSEAESIPGPFITVDQYSSIARIFNAIIRGFGNEGIDVSVSDDVVRFDLTDAGLKKRDDGYDDNGGRYPDGCLIPDLSLAQGFNFSISESADICGGTLANAGPGTVYDFQSPAPIPMGIIWTDECYYTLRFTVESNLPNNGAGDFTSAGINVFGFSGLIAAIVGNGSLPLSCAMIVKTQSFDLTYTGAQWKTSPFGLEYFYDRNNIGNVQTGMSGAYVKILSVAVIGSSH